MCKPTPRWGPLLLFAFALLLPASTSAQQTEALKGALSARQFREVGTAVAGGRIAGTVVQAPVAVEDD